MCLGREGGAKQHASLIQHAYGREERVRQLRVHRLRVARRLDPIDDDVAVLRVRVEEAVGPLAGDVADRRERPVAQRKHVAELDRVCLHELSVGVQEVAGRESDLGRSRRDLHKLRTDLRHLVSEEEDLARHTTRERMSLSRVHARVPCEHASRIPSRPTSE